MSEAMACFLSGKFSWPQECLLNAASQLLCCLLLTVTLAQSVIVWKDSFHEELSRSGWPTVMLVGDYLDMF